MYFTPGETIFHGKDFYSQALEIIWTKKTNSVAKNINELGKVSTVTLRISILGVSKFFFPIKITTQIAHTIPLSTTLLF